MPRAASSVPSDPRPLSARPPKLQRAFTSNTLTDKQREEILHKFKTGPFRKSLKADVVTAVDKETGEVGRWIRPNLHFDPSPSHVPPPPAEPVPEDVLKAPRPPATVPMAVQDDKAPGRRSLILAKTSAGVYVKPPSSEQAGDVLAARKSVEHKRASFVAEAARPRELREESLKAIKSSKFRKSLTADEVVTLDQTTGELGRWVRPRLTFDPSAEHVPPPPAEPVPADILAKPPPPMTVPMTVQDNSAPGRKSLIMVRRTSGTYPADPNKVAATRAAQEAMLAKMAAEAKKTGGATAGVDASQVEMQIAEESAQKSKMADDVLSGRGGTRVITSGESGMVSPSYASNYGQNRAAQPDVSSAGKEMAKMSVGSSDLEEESSFDTVKVFTNPRRSLQPS